MTHSRLLCYMYVIAENARTVETKHYLGLIFANSDSQRKLSRVDCLAKSALSRKYGGETSLSIIMCLNERNQSL